MNEDEQALIRWVKGADDHGGSNDDPSWVPPVHWAPAESTGNSDDILQHPHWVPQGGFDCPSIVFDANIGYSYLTASFRL